LAHRFRLIPNKKRKNFPLSPESRKTTSYRKWIPAWLFIDGEGKITLLLLHEPTMKRRQKQQKKRLTRKPTYFYYLLHL
jgi:hypothetical protein